MVGQAVAGQRPNRRHCRRHAGGRGDELQERDHEHLRQVRQAGLAAVVLQVGVGDEARDRVEGQRRLHVGDAVGVERQHGLERDDGERHQPHHHVRGEQRDRVARPVLLGGRVDAGDAEHERSIGPRTGSSQVRRPENTLAMCWPSSALVPMVTRMVRTTAVYSVATAASEFLGAEHRVDQVDEGSDAQQQ